MRNTWDDFTVKQSWGRVTTPTEERRDSKTGSWERDYYRPWEEFRTNEDDKWAERQRKLLNALAAELEQERTSKGAVHDVSETEMAAKLRKLAAKLAEDDPSFMDEEQNKKVIASILDDMYRMGPLQELWANPLVSDIQVFVPWENRYPQIITYVERGERKVYKGQGFRDYDHARDWLNRHLSRIGLRYDPADVQLDGMFPDGERVHVISGTSGYSVFNKNEDKAEYKFIRSMIISIRRFVHAFTLDDLTDLVQPSLTPPAAPKRIRPKKWKKRTVYTPFTGGSFDLATREFASYMTKLHKNHVICGGTGAGKTTFANALTSEIPDGTVLLILEEAPEMQPQRDFGIIRIYERRGVKSEGGKDFTIADGLKGALRMFPDRIFVAELRDAVAFVFLEAIQSGHDGSSTTVHASSCRAAIERIINMAAQHPSAPDRESIRQILFERIDTIIHVRREGSKRFVDEVIQLRPDGTIHTVTEFVQQGVDGNGNPIGYWAFHGPCDEFVEEMIRKGFDIPKSWGWEVEYEGVSSE